MANVRLADGAERVLAVETKVHSNGSREQLARTTEGRDDAAGVLLALGFTGLKMSRWDTDEVGEAGAAWAFVDAAAWLELLGSVEQAPHWLPPYRDAVEQWSTWLAAGRGPLDDRMATELEHLRWFADLRPHLHRPGKWQPVVTRQSGPLLSLFAWGEPGADVYLEAMGFWRSGRRRLHLKVGGDPSNVGPLRERMLSVVEHVPELRPARGRFREGHRSASIAVHEYEDATPAEAARVTNRMEGALDALVGRD